MIGIARIWTIAANGFREVIRDRVLYVIVFFAIVMAIALRLLPEISATTEDKIVIDVGLGAIGALGALVAIFIGTGLINKEIEKRTVLILIPKPMSRAELIIGKHLGLVGVLLVLVAAMSGIYFLSLVWAKVVFHPGSVPSILVSLLYLSIELGILVAAALAFGVFTSSLLATLMTFGIYLMGHFSRDLVELGKISKNTSIEWFTQGLYLILPDLSRLNLRNDAVYGVLPPTSQLLGDAVYGVVYITVLLAIAILIFSRRQF
ncbi:ABC transporter permease [Lusitaniella coriacea LEGE 07167]|nr:ABC transporter permease [Lusitaniella coriacea]